MANKTPIPPAKPKKPSAQVPTPRYTCQTCTFPFDNEQRLPRDLSCGHSFCTSCLSEMCHGRQYIKCPTCRVRFEIPKQGVHEIQPNQLASRVHMNGANNSCAKHLDQPMLFYCQNCDVPICMHCTVLDHDKNNGHQIIDIADAIKRRKEKLHQVLQDLDEDIAACSQTMAQLQMQVHCLDACKAMAVGRINTTFNELQKQLENRRNELLNEVSREYVTTKEEIKKEAEYVKNAVQQLENWREDVKRDLVANAKSAIPNIPKIAARFSDTLPKREHVGFIDFNYKHNLDEYLSIQRQVGHMSCEKPLPSRIEITHPTLITGLASCLTVTLQTPASTPVLAGALGLKIESNDGTVKPETLESHMDAKSKHYTFIFQPVRSGSYTVTPVYCDVPFASHAKHIVVSSNDPVQVLGHGELKRPTSVAVSQAGYIYVADVGNKRIMVFEGDGAPSFNISLGGSLTYDVCINYAIQVLMYIRVSTNEAGQIMTHTVQSIDLNGEKVSHFTNGEMDKAMFLCVNSKGHVIVSDSAKHCIYVYSKEGIPIKRFGSFGSTPGCLDFPTAVRVGPNDSIYVSDTRNNRVQVFSESGQFLKVFGPDLGSGVSLNMPRGLAVDKHVVLIADSVGRVVVINTKAKILWTIDSDKDPIPEPYNVAIAGRYAYIADFRNNCVKKFQVR